MLRTYIFYPIIVIFLLSSCSTTNELANHGTNTLAPAVQQSTPPSTPTLNIPNNDQGKILQYVSDKVYQVLVKKKKDHLVTYSKEIPKDDLPFELRESDFMSVGSAFSLSPGKYLSCAHVFNLHLNPNPEEFFLKDAKGKIYNIDRVLKYSSHHDVIEFTLADKVELPTLTFDKNYVIGQSVFSVGNALGIGISVRSGVLSSFTFEPEFGEWKNIRFSAPASPGNSGGPLVDEKGNVLGIIQAKSENENLNYAFPIELLNEVSSKESHVKTKQHFSPYGFKEIFVIDFKESLPQKIETIQRHLYSQFSAKSKTNAKDFFDKYKAQLPNNDTKVEEYLMNQPISKTWQKIHRKKNGLWTNYMPPFDVEKFEDNDEIGFAISGQNEEITVFFAHFLYQFKKAANISKSLENPAMVITRAINHILGGIKFGNASIDVKSIKEAEETYWYRDNLKRLWRLDFWRLKTYGLSIISACASHPKGLACHLFPPIETLYEGYGALSLIQQELDAWIIAPSGTIEQWKEYLKIKPQYLWPLVGDVQLSLDKKKVLNIETENYQLNLPVPPIFNRLEFSLNLGFETKLPLKLKNHGLSLYDAFGRTYFYHVFQKKPSNNADEQQQILWKQITSRQAEFSGEIYKDQHEKKLVLIGYWDQGKFKELSSQSSPMNSTLSEIQKIFCYTDIHHDDIKFKNWCLNFTNSLTQLKP